MKKTPLKELKKKYEELYYFRYGFKLGDVVPSFKYKQRNFCSDRRVRLKKSLSNALKRAWYARKINDLEWIVERIKRNLKKSKSAKQVAQKRQKEIQKWKRFYEKHH